MSAAAGTIISFNRREKKSAGRPGDEEEAPLMRKTLVYPADLLSGHEEERTGVNNRCGKNKCDMIITAA